MDSVRIGIIGLGNMGTFHLKALADLPGAKVTAVWARSLEKLERAAVPADVKRFSNLQELIRSGTVDALLVATPHRVHAEAVIAGLEAGLHVLCEKPIASTLTDAYAMQRASAARADLKFGLMFQMRTYPIYRNLRELVQSGELGEISRVTWLVTDWFRTWRYYASGGWRATWAGEAGGVLINQCPHNLDLLGWITALSPSRVTAVATVGKAHPIEVEDEVSGIIEFSSGAIGHFVTTTGEAPGVNRLEIAGDRGRVVAENGTIVFHQTRESVKKVRESSPEPFARIETSPTEVAPPSAPPDAHARVLANFVGAIQKNEPLIAPAEDGVRELELGAAMQMAGLTRQPVEFPLNAEKFDQFLAEMTAQFGGKKSLPTIDLGPVDMSSSFR